MVEYSHLDKSAMCASTGYYVGKKGSEVQIASGAGILYGGGNQIANADGRLFQAGNALTERRALGSAAAAGTYRIAAGEFGCSKSGTIDCGLTTVTNVVWSVKGKPAAGNVNTLDLVATPDPSLGKDHNVASAQARFGNATQTGGNIRFRTYDASMDAATKLGILSYIAFGT